MPVSSAGGSDSPTIAGPRAQAFVALLLRLAGGFINLPVPQLDAAIDQALADTGAFVGADRAYLFRYDFGQRIGCNTHEWCAEGVLPQREALQAVPMEAVPDWLEAHLRGEAVHVPDAAALPPCRLRELLELQGICTTIALPLLGEAGCAGFVGFDFVRAPRVLGAEVVELLKLFAQMLVNVGDRVRAQEALVGLNASLEARVARRTQELAEAKERAESADRAKSALMARVSHELRTPLNAVLGFAELLAGDTVLQGSPAAAAQVAQIRRAGTHLLGMVDEVLDLARAESGRLELRREPLDLGLLATEMLQLAEPWARRHRVRLEPAPPAGGPWASADRMRLSQVLMNLVSNAIKYNRPGGWVRLSIEADESRCRVVVEDSGVGLDEAQRHALFQPFNRLGAERSGVQGTGLGLVISHDLVQRMGGELLVHSVPGQGSQFSVVLPRAVPPGDGAEAAPANAVDNAPANPPVNLPANALAIAAGTGPESAAMPQTGAFSSGTDPAPNAGLAPRQRAMAVLYIEDNPVNAMLMEAMLARPECGWVTLQAEADGPGGLQAVGLSRPDLVLLDMSMPGMDGMEVLRHLRADATLAGLPCVAVSAHALASDIAAALEAGFDDYVTKPFTLERLVALLDRYRPA
jgi:signal transduction histidine kinase/ActR/RegA family two-component response regulator